MIAQLAGAVEYSDCTAAEGYPMSVLDMKLWWSSGNAGDLGNAEHPFIAIAPRSTLARRGSTW